jgi:hypothetical protein
VTQSQADSGIVTTPDSDSEEIQATAPPAPETPAPPAPERVDWWKRRWVVAAVFVVAGAALFLVYLAQARTLPVHSDSASASGPETLQAWEMLHGNLLLRGWGLSDVSFYTTELPEYMLVELIRGLSGDVVHVAAALTYTLMVLLAGLLAKGRATGREGLVRLLIAVGIMLAPSLAVGTRILLAGPDHTGTQVPLLLIWLVLDRVRWRWWLPVLVGVMLAWAQIADLLVLYEGVLPLIVVCVVRMYRRRGPLAGQMYELSLVAGALCSVVAAKLTVTLIQHVGGFAVRTPVARFATASEFSAEFWPKAQKMLQVFGADVFGLGLGRSAIAAIVHMVGVALVVWAVAVAVRRFNGKGDLLVEVLVVTFILLLAAYLIGTKSNPNEAIGLLPIGAVLAGRLLAGRIISDGLVPALAVVLVCYGAVLLANAAHRPASLESRPPAAWFEAHHLTYGLGEFSDSSIITVDSGNRVVIRATRIFRHRLVTTSWETNSSWFDARQHDATFVMWKLPSTCGTTCSVLTDLRRMYGPPAVTYQIDGFTVLAWNKNLLGPVRRLSWCGHAWPWKAQGKPSSGPCR